MTRYLTLCADQGKEQYFPNTEVSQKQKLGVLADEMLAERDKACIE